MGCDIHAYVETLYPIGEGREPWADCFAQVFLGRNYDLFAIMADVRNGNSIEPIFQPRGIPAEPISLRVAFDLHLCVTEEPSEDEHNVARAQAEEWVARGISRWADELKLRVTHPDWHSHTWFTTAELKRVNEMYLKEFGSTSGSLAAVIAMMETLEAIPERKARLVVWFDN